MSGFRVWKMSGFRVIKPKTRSLKTSTSNSSRVWIMASFCFSFFLCCGSAAPFLPPSSSSSYHLVSRPLSSLSSPTSPRLHLSVRKLFTPLSHSNHHPRRLTSSCARPRSTFSPTQFPNLLKLSQTSSGVKQVQKMTKKKKDLFGDSIEEAVRVCTEILSNFLHTEYGGPGTLLVIPFIDMADALNERGLPGGPQAARAAVVWAQKHVDKDWNEWNKEGKEDPKQRTVLVFEWREKVFFFLLSQ